MTSSRISSFSGYSLIELVVVILILGVLAAVAIEYLGTNPDAERFESTREQMKALQIAILGDPAASYQGHRMSFGYVGDWGSLPTSIADLNTAQVPAYAFNSTYGFGAGWKGPYVQGSLGTSNISKDSWGNAFAWAPAASPPSLTSYGADGVAGGTLYNTDLVQTLPTTLWQATVNGTLVSGTTAVAGATVEIRYPVSGTITAFTTVTSATGTFSFSSVPFGVRSLSVTSSPTLGPVQIFVDNYQYEAHLQY